MELLKVADVAQRLKLSRSMVYMLCQRGELPTVKIGAAVRVPSDQLDAWIIRQQAQESPVAGGAR